MENAPYKRAQEQELLGAMLTAPDKVIPLIIGNLRKDDFNPGNKHSLIYEGILEVYNKGDPVTLTEVTDYLEKTYGERTGSIPGYLAELVKNVPTTSFQDQVILHYARQLRDARIQRNLDTLSLAIKEDVKADKPILDIIKGIRKQMDTLTTEIEFEEFRYDKDVLTDITGELDNRMKRYKEGEEVTGLKTGFDHLDNLINGLQTGLYVLGSAPAQGKTTFCKQLADQVAINNKIPVVFVSYEQSKFELIIKSLSRLAQIDSLHLQKGKIKDVDLLVKKESEYYDDYAPYLVTIEAELNTSLDKIGAYAMRAMRERNKDKCLIILDYLQVIPYEKDFKDRRAKIDEILTELRRLARRLDCPIWLVSSFSREAYKTYKKGKAELETKPDMTSFKESGNIEYTADVAILMSTEEKEQDQKKRRTVHFEIIKNRNGLRGEIVFDFSPAISVFKELEKRKLKERDLI
mgnify:CR=1 FL=1